MKGHALASEYHAIHVVAALDIGYFPEIFSTAIYDRFCYANLIGMVDKRAREAEFRLDNYFPTNLVTRDHNSLIWRPDPEYDNWGYRAARWIRFIPVGRITVDDIWSMPAALVVWETGHGSESTFINRVVGVCRYEACYCDDFGRKVMEEHGQEVADNILRTMRP